MCLYILYINIYMHVYIYIIYIYYIYTHTHTHIYVYIYGYRASLVAQMVKHLPAMLETRVWSLGQEEPLEKEMATHSSTLAWEIP